MTGLSDSDLDYLIKKCNKISESDSGKIKSSSIKNNGDTETPSKKSNINPVDSLDADSILWL